MKVQYTFPGCYYLVYFQLYRVFHFSCLSMDNLVILGMDNPLLFEELQSRLYGSKVAKLKYLQ